MMKLNPECVRDILLALNNVMKPDEFGNVRPAYAEVLLEDPSLSCYEQSEIFYTVKNLFDEELLKQGKHYTSEKLPLIADVTQKGYQFLAATTPPTVWDKVKEAAKAGLAITITTMLETAVANSMG